MGTFGRRHEEYAHRILAGRTPRGRADVHGLISTFRGYYTCPHVPQPPRLKGLAARPKHPPTIPSNTPLFRAKNPSMYATSTPTGGRA